VLQRPLLRRTSAAPTVPLAATDWNRRLYSMALVPLASYIGT
jgi:hypothetical protein